MKYLVAILSLTLGACATPLPDSVYHWHHGGAQPLPMTIHQVDQDTVQALCCNTNVHVLACAFRIPEQNFCGVYTSYPKLPEETLLHEKKHCDGWVHQVLNPVDPTATGKVCKTPADL